jgi:hypothetical protein
MLEVAGVVARLGFRVDDEGARRFQSELNRTREQAKHGAVATLDAKPDLRGFDVYERKLKDVQQRTQLRDAYRAKLGAAARDGPRVRQHAAAA